MLRDIRPEIDSALLAIGTRRGITFQMGRATCSQAGDEGSFKVSMRTLAEDGTPNDRNAYAFVKYAAMIGLEPTDLGRKILVAGKLLTIAGYLPGSRKNPVAVKDENGKDFVISIATAKAALAKLPS